MDPEGPILPRPTVRGGSCPFGGWGWLQGTHPALSHGARGVVPFWGAGVDLGVPSWCRAGAGAGAGCDMLGDFRRRGRAGSRSWRAWC